MSDSTAPTMEKFPAPKQRRMHALLDLNAEGQITADERRELEVLVDEAETLMVENSKRLADFAKAQSGGIPSAAVPVTVWLQPEAAST